jgi:NADP-reducing hydrogenase subunit HndC
MIKSIADLDKIKKESLPLIKARFKEIKADEKGEYPKDIERHVVVCAGSGCVSCDCLPVFEKLQNQVEKEGLKEKVKIIKTGCVGCCVAGPILVVYPEGVFYQKVDTGDIPKLVESHLKGGKPVESLMWTKPKNKKEIVPLLKDIGYFKVQKKIVLSSCGIVDPVDINEYIAVDGYQATAKAILNMKPEEIRQEVKTSYIRGRGGAGFPAGLKWEFAAKAEGDAKYVICNADEGDPGAFMDRSILEGDPHAVIEGMIICGYAIGSNNGYVYIRAEYPLAIKRLDIALKQAREYGFLGKGVLGTDFDFDIEVRIGAGAFVCGEETALMFSIEGKRGEPRARPPYPAISGLWQKPSNINNVETLANIPWIIRNGGKAYAAIGTEKSKGTKVFALAGDVVNTGLVEVPMGSTLREIVFDIGGGVVGRGKFKAAQLGGPSGGCIPAKHLDTPIDYDSLLKLGAMIGSGGLIVMDTKTCMVDIAKFFMEFVQDESCGKCPPCRVGTKRMLETLERISKGNGEEGDIDKLMELSDDIRLTSLCGLGQTAANPILSTIRYFKEEYERHIKDKICLAGVCSDLIRFVVDKELCKKCGICLKVCDYEAIHWVKGEVAKIYIDKCVKCRKCIEECPFNSIY